MLGSVVVAFVDTLGILQKIVLVAENMAVSRRKVCLQNIGLVAEE